MSRAQTLPVLGPVAVLGLFLGACALPAGYYRGKFLEEGVSADGWRVALFGWGALPLAGLPALAWFANPLFGAGLVCLWRGRHAAAAKCAAAATGLGLLPLGLLPVGWSASVRTWPDPALVFTHEWGDKVVAQAELQAGYFQWVTALGLQFAIAVVCWYRGREPSAPPALLE
ncbi:MAG TPA: hypothetical protein VKE40_03710 [Gemmataceae bacterium]|nr:hypothetical protein [Gemmataceae bacterium]